MKAYRFGIPLTRPLLLRGQSHSVREGILVERGGRWAEASPLPGFSGETIEDVIAALRGEREAPASLRFALAGLEHPIIDSLAVPFNVLLSGNRESVLAKVDRCAQSACRAAKLKVGRGGLDSDIRLVKEVRERLPASVLLRLDANRAWTFGQAATFQAAVSGVELEYIEEPLQDASQLEELYSCSGVRYALDETLLVEHDLTSWPSATALVCKPTILGGRDAVERLATTGKPIVFSAAFESGVGISRIVQFATEFSPDVAAGLDTLDWLEDDLLLASPQKQNGVFTLSGEPQVDPDCLEAIAL